MFNLYDYKNEEISTGDIVKSENFIFGYTYYYLIGTKMMYRYDESGLFKKDSYNNSPINWSVTLINDDNHRWTRLGTESEVYDEIFNK